MIVCSKSLQISVWQTISYAINWSLIYTAAHEKAAAIPVVLFVAKTVKLVDPIFPIYILVVLVGE